MNDADSQFRLSRTLAYIAIGLWLLSLFLPAFSSFGGKVTWGMEVLIIGWLGVIALNVAWFANLFILYAMPKLAFSNGIPSRSTFAALILSLDTFLFEFMPAATREQPIYGLGLGAILWLGAIFFIFASAQIREMESNLGGPRVNLVRNYLNQLRKKSLDESIHLDRSILFYLYLPVAFFCIAIGLGIYDRIVGNEDEQKLLNSTGTVFKRSEICSLKPTSQNKILLDGPLELVDGDTHLIGYPETFLKMGIPVVRVVTREPVKPEKRDSLGSLVEEPVSRDWFLKDQNDPKSITWKYGEGESAAKLIASHVRYEHNDYDSTMEANYHLSLISKKGVVGFDFFYLKQYYMNVCPQLTGEGRYSLENLIKQTLIIPSKKINQ